MLTKFLVIPIYKSLHSYRTMAVTCTRVEMLYSSIATVQALEISIPFILKALDFCMDAIHTMDL